MSPEKMARLRRLHDRGHLRFVLLQGVIGWGMLTVMAFALLTSWWDKKPFFDVLPRAAVMFGVGGVLWGEMMWRQICTQVRREERRRPA